MRETRFIEQNKEKWSNFEKTLTKKNKDPNKLSDLFIQVTDDLSYSRTYYSKRSVKVYLNNLAQKTFISIYKNKRIEKGTFLKFWTKDLPLLIYDCRGAFRLSFFVFLISFTIGWLSSTYDKDFVRSILGDGYVEMTIENIEDGDPMGVYKGDSQFESFVWITVNNLQVDFYTFIMGLFFSIGTIFVILSNGIMIGSFMQFFYEYGVFEESFLGVMQHGTIEISTIIISGAAGITLGKGLLFPKTHSRLYSFQISAIKGLKIILGVLPLTIFAGFIEGFVTRLTDTPDYIRVITIVLSLLYVLIYFVWYPIRVAKRTDKAVTYGDKLPPTPKLHIDFYKLKQNGEVFTETFLIFRSTIAKTIKPIVLFSFIISCISVFILDEGFGSVSNGLYYGNNLWQIVILLFEQIGSLQILFNYQSNIVLLPINIVIYSIISIYGLYPIHELYLNNKLSFSFKNSVSFLKKNIVKVIAIITVSHLLLFIPTVGGDILFYLSTPIIIYCLVSVTTNGNGIFESIKNAFSFYFSSFGKNFGFFSILSIVSLLLLLFINAPTMWFIVDYSNQLLGIESGLYYTIIKLLVITIKILSFNLCIILFIKGFGLLYFNVREINTAAGLKKQILNFNKK